MFKNRKLLHYLLQTNTYSSTRQLKLCENAEENVGMKYCMLVTPGVSTVAYVAIFQIIYSYQAFN